jgi:hypothetical protein
MDKFNTNLTQLLNTIKRLYPEQIPNIDKHYNLSEATDKYLLEFWENCKDKGNDISTKNEIIFSKNSIILVNVDFNKIWNDESLQDSEKDNIWKIIQSLWIFAFQFIKDQDLKSILKTFKKLGENRDSLDEESKAFLNIIDSLTDKFAKADISGNDTDEFKEDGNESSGFGFDFNIPELLDGEIGKIAKEIAEEIDPSDLDLSNKEELVKNLMSGNFDEENDKSGVVKLVKNISEKIHNKIESGQIDKDKIMKEAEKIMKQFGGGKNKNPMSMFSNIMKSQMGKNMSDEEKDLFNQAAQIIGNGGKVMNINPHQLRNKMALRTTKERLLKKLEEKKAKKLLENSSSNTETNSENNNKAKQSNKKK